jgi:flagellar biosynthesis anti-sigma factor FlgM
MVNVLEEIIMVNQINDSTGVKAMDLDSRLKTRTRESKEPVAEHIASSENDSVNISDISKHLESIKASFKDVSEVDSKKVSHFKAVIAEGKYQIDSSAIAQKMVHNNLELA